MKVGSLTDDQLNNGMTEKKAMDLINKAKKTGNWSEVEKEGLQNFRRDTMWVAVMDTIFAKGFNPDSLAYVLTETELNLKWLSVRILQNLVLL